AARDRRLADAVAVVAGDHDRIAVRVDAADDADMAAAAAARHHRDGADLRTGDTRSVMRERARHVGAGTLMAGVLQHHVQEARAPQAASAGRIAAEITARLGDEARSATEAAARGRTTAVGVRIIAGLGIAEATRLQLLRVALEAPVMMMSGDVVCGV